MLKYNEVNPLNVHGLREMSHCPPHFQKFIFDKLDAGLHTKKSIKIVVDWIYENLSGRFYIKSLNTKNIKYTIAFEEHAELSFFILSIPTIYTP